MVRRDDGSDDEALTLRIKVTDDFVQENMVTEQVVDRIPDIRLTKEHERGPLAILSSDTEQRVSC